MSNLFTVAHIAQLHEIQSARLKRNQPGIGPEVEELIRRLTDGGVAGNSDDIRRLQARRLWLDVSTHFGSTFESYLASIPKIPSRLASDDAEFPMLVLVEPRIGLKKLCEQVGIEFDGDDEMFVAYDDRHAEFTEPTWIRIQDGRKNRNRSVRDCRKSLDKNELGLTAFQGICSYLQHRNILTEAMKDGAHNMDFSGSVPRRHHDCVGSLKLTGGQPILGWHTSDPTNPRYGSASRREC